MHSNTKDKALREERLKVITKKKKKNEGRRKKQLPQSLRKIKRSDELTNAEASIHAIKKTESVGVLVQSSKKRDKDYRSLKMQNNKYNNKYKCGETEHNRQGY